MDIKNTALITGASSGFGLEFARLFAADGYNLALVARPNGKLASIVKDLKNEFGVQIVYNEADLAVPGAAQTLYDWTVAQKLEVAVLVNNAGIGLYGHFTQHTLAQEQELVNLNVNTLTELCHLFLPQMVKRGTGKILNVASIAGFQAGPYYATYFASKGYVLLFSEALYHEYKEKGIQITTLCPGVAQTGFFKRANMREDSPILQRYFMSPTRVTKEGYEGLMAGKRIVIPGKRNKFVALGYRIIPRSMITSISKQLIQSAARRSDK